MPEDNEIFVHQCDICGATVECIGVSAVYALENEWHISLYYDFCSKCRNSEKAEHAIARVNKQYEIRAGQLAMVILKSKKPEAE